MLIGGGKDTLLKRDDLDGAERIASLSRACLLTSNFSQKFKEWLLEDLDKLEANNASKGDFNVYLELYNMLDSTESETGRFI